MFFDRDSYFSCIYRRYLIAFYFTQQLFKPMTTKDLIDILKKLPPDLTVQCLQAQCFGYTECVNWKNLTKDDIYVIGEFLEIGNK